MRIHCWRGRSPGVCFVREQDPRRGGGQHFEHTRVRQVRVQTEIARAYFEAADDHRQKRQLALGQ